MRSPAVPTAAISATPARSRLLDHAGDRLDRPLRSAPAASAPVSSQALAEPRDLGAVDDRAPGAVGAALADVELDRVRADVDHRVARRAEADERLEPAREADVRPAGEPELAHGRDHERRDPPTRRRSSASTGLGGRDLGQLRHAAADRVVLAPLVHLDRRAGRGSARRARRRAASSVYVVARELRRRRRRARRSTARDVRRRRAGSSAFSTGRHCSSPSSSTRLEPLHVHQAVADLDRGVALRARAGRSRRSPARARARARRGGSSASPKLSPNVRHSQRGTMPATLTPLCLQRPREVLERLARLRLLLAREVDAARRRGRRGSRRRPGRPRSSRQRVESSRMREPSG